jgi:hypothetical protein
MTHKMISRIDDKSNQLEVGKLIGRINGTYQMIIEFRNDCFDRDNRWEFNRFVVSHLYEYHYSNSKTLFKIIKLAGVGDVKLKENKVVWGFPEYKTEVILSVADDGKLIMIYDESESDAESDDEDI